MDIQTLRKMRGIDFSKITEQLNKIANPSSESKSYKDDRFWKLESDKAGNASAVIRFLPTCTEEELPWVQVFSHAFQGPTGKWYIENSLTTINEEDPVGQLNNKLWNSTTDDNSPERKQARAQKRKLHYISNILVVSDPKHPENEGKVFLFKYGKKIFDKIMEKAFPTFEDEKQVNVFDLWEGADFKLRQRKVEGYPNYDQSVFATPSAVFNGDEDKLLGVVKAQYKLSEFKDPKNFKSYEELSRKLQAVLNGDATPSRSAEKMIEDEEVEVRKPSAPEPVAQKKVTIDKPIVEDDDDDVISYFQKIANES